jgi:cytochrome c-type biogenesis protein CcmH/NrfF
VTLRVLALLALLLLPAASRAETNADAERWAYDLSHELMSPFCPGRTLHDCPSPQADELRRWILEQARAGVPKEAVEAQLLQSFGERILQAPKAEGIGLVAYVVPVGFLIAGGGLLAFFLRRRAGGGPAAAAPVAAPRDPDLERWLDREIDEAGDP